MIKLVFTKTNMNEIKTNGNWFQKAFFPPSHLCYMDLSHEIIRGSQNIKAKFKKLTRLLGFEEALIHSNGIVPEYKLLITTLFYKVI